MTSATAVVWLLVMGIATPNSATAPDFGPYPDKALCERIGDTRRALLMATEQNVAAIPRCIPVPPGVIPVH